MKKLTAILCMIFISLSFSLSACSNNYDDGKINIVCTIFPIYDWVTEIIGKDNSDSDIKITYLLENGSDLHNYEPSISDVAKISSCDLFIYVGGESDEWVTKVLAQKKNKNMVILNLLDILGNNAKVEEVKEGMQIENEGEDEELDEHIWLSLKNCKLFCNKILDAIKTLDAKNANKYTENLKNYQNSIDLLDNEYELATKIPNKKPILFSGRFPFRYLVDDYNIDYYAAFLGCSADVNASAETIIKLAEIIDKEKLKVIFIIQGDDIKDAESLKNGTTDKNQEIVSMNSMQNISIKDIENGATYLSIMTENLESLKKGLEV